MARDFADKSAARQWVWDRLSAEGVARFPFPPHGRIPNFAGAEVAATRLLDIEPWKSAAALKVNPDAPQRPLRAEALRRGITVFVPTPRLRGGFKKLDPRRIPPDKIEAAASLSRGSRWSEEVAVAEMPQLDAIVCGSVAVTRDGRRCGKGEGYSDLEFAILRELGHPSSAALRMRIDVRDDYFARYWGRRSVSIPLLEVPHSILCVTRCWREADSNLRSLSRIGPSRV